VIAASSLANSTVRLLLLLLRLLLIVSPSHNYYELILTFIVNISSTCEMHSF
jgi:hypothetical protein